MPTITPEQQITNLLDSALALAALAPHAGQKSAILATLRQVVQAWEQYQDGTLAPLTHEGPL
jgi:hypothetical protein